MPRAARLRLPGVPLHILQRGHNRAACFGDKADYELYLGLLQEYSSLHRCPVHAYVLMTNHIHLLATPLEPQSASEMMRSINQRYVQHVNRKQERTGSLWEGRFRASLVDSESYLFTCQRYVEMNPVRASMVDYPGQYPWSSYRANAEGAPSRIVVPHELARALGRDDSERLEGYRALFTRPLSSLQLDAVRRAIKADRPLGDARFLGMLEGQFGKRAAAPQMGRPRGDAAQGQRRIFPEK